MGSRAVFQYASDARPPEALRASRGYDFDNLVQNTHSSRRLSRDWRGEGGFAAKLQIRCTVPQKESLQKYCFIILCNMLLYNKTKA